MSKVARYVMITTSLLMVVYGVVVIFQPNLFSNNMEVYTGVTIDELQLSYPKLTTYIAMMFALIGGFNVIVGTAALLCIYRSFKLKEKWLLALIFLTSILGYANPISFDLISGVIAPAEVTEFIGLALNIIAFLIIMPEFKKIKS